jgi:ribonuclease BN (tRNA processing enzyme)
VVVLDAGSGIAHVQDGIEPEVHRIDLLLTHLHMDHIQGLGFFRPLRDPAVETHIWGPVSTTMHLAERLSRYLSPPLFPVRLREMASVQLHDVAPGRFRIGEFSVQADLILHPGPTLGYRLEEGGHSVVYMPDHEPALGCPEVAGPPEWVSGSKLAAGADLLIHDAQYTNEEYQMRVGWGHSSYRHVVAFAELAGVDRLVTFHHDPEHTDRLLDDLHERARSDHDLPFELVAGTAGAVLEL